MGLSSGLSTGSQAGPSAVAFSGLARALSSSACDGGQYGTHGKCDTACEAGLLQPQADGAASAGARLGICTLHWPYRRRTWYTFPSLRPSAELRWKSGMPNESTWGEAGGGQVGFDWSV